MKGKEKQNRDLIISRTDEARQALNKAQKAINDLKNAIMESGLNISNLEIKTLLHINSRINLDYMMITDICESLTNND